MYALRLVTTLILLSVLLLRCNGLRNFDFCKEEDKLQKMIKYREDVCSSTIRDESELMVNFTITKHL